MMLFCLQRSTLKLLLFFPQPYYYGNNFFFHRTLLIMMLFGFVFFALQNRWSVPSPQAHKHLNS